MFFRMLYDDKLGQASYIIGCQRTGEALVLDPERDVERYIDAAEKEQLRITAIAETHIHADFLSGARELAERTGARLYLSDEADQEWKYRWLDAKSDGGTYLHQLLHDGDIFKVGNIEFRVRHTPGHTPEHISFLVTDHGGGADEPMGIASGDFVFVGDVGRPDLLETAAGQKGTKETSAISLFDSLQQFKALPDFLQLWPGHGAGSACGKAPGAVPQSTVGYEKKFNNAIQQANEQSCFIPYILSGQTAPPLYFGRMKKLNRDGPPLLGNLPQPREIKPEDLRTRPDPDTTILDTRSWQSFAAGHLRGSLFIPFESSFPTIAGSYIPESQKLILIIRPDYVREAVTALVRIGLDNIVAFIHPESLDTEPPGLEQAPYRNITEFKVGSEAVLDVRQMHEFEDGHVPKAANIPHTRLLAELDAIPTQGPVFTYCQTGIRSAFATALLRSKGLDAVQLEGGFAAWQQSGGQVAYDKAVNRR